jgi:hypothetical protein
VTQQLVVSARSAILLPGYGPAVSAIIPIPAVRSAISPIMGGTPVDRPSFHFHGNGFLPAVRVYPATVSMHENTHQVHPALIGPVFLGIHFGLNLIEV